jgi:hypothetical protein
LGVAVVAVVLAASGAGYAAGSGSARSITACVHHKGGGLYSAAHCAHGDRRLTWSVKGPTGPTGPAGTTMFAQVEANGTLNTSSPGVTSILSDSNYFVNFGRDVTHCAAVAQEGSIPAFSGGSIGSSPPETPDVIISDGSSTYTTGFPEDDTVNVRTYLYTDDTHAPTVGDTPFYLTVTC